MNQYKNVALAAGVGLTALGVFHFADIAKRVNNPYWTYEVSGIINLQKDVEVFREEFMKTHNSRPDYASVWDFDAKSRDLLTKLNQPLETKQKTLKELYDCYQEEINRRTLTNKTWDSYVSWDKSTKEKNKSDLTYGLISMLAGIGLLAVSRKK